MSPFSISLQTLVFTTQVPENDPNRPEGMVKKEIRVEGQQKETMKKDICCTQTPRLCATWQSQIRSVPSIVVAQCRETPWGMNGPPLALLLQFFMTIRRARAFDSQYETNLSTPLAKASLTLEAQVFKGAQIRHPSTSLHSAASGVPAWETAKTGGSPSSH